MKLRSFRGDDALRVLELIGDPQTYPHSLGMLTPATLEAARHWIGSLSSLPVRAVCDDNDLILGFVSLTIQKNPENAELGFWIGKLFWGRGYATRAVRAMLEFGFHDLDLHRIFAKQWSNNPATARVLQKAGLTKEGVFREEANKDGKYHDLIFYSILRNEFDQLPPPAPSLLADN